MIMAAPASGRSRPSIMRIVVDFPSNGLGHSYRLSWVLPGCSGHEGTGRCRSTQNTPGSPGTSAARLRAWRPSGPRTPTPASELGLTIGASYVDNDLSAYTGVERPDYERLLADITAGKIGTLIIWHANRLHRSTEEVNAFIKLARAHKVRLYSTTKGAFYNLDKASGRKELRDDTSEAEYESEHRGERVAIARKRQARHGVYGGGVRPYGWGAHPPAPGWGRGWGGRARCGTPPATTRPRRPRSAAGPMTCCRACR